MTVTGVDGLFKNKRMAAIDSLEVEKKQKMTVKSIML